MLNFWTSRCKPRLRRKPNWSALSTIELLEERVLLSADIRTIDGTGNNFDHSDWGSAEIQLLRLSTVEYEDGKSAPAGADRPSARVISNAVSQQSESIPNDRNLTGFVWQWGQFLDHDIDLTGGAVPAEEFNIEVPTGDPFFDPFHTGTQTISLSRSVYDTKTGKNTHKPRQQLNGITSYIDASNVYGSDQERADFLRTFSGGKLKTSDSDLLPFNTGGFDNAGGPSPALFLAGDVRANEQVGLTAMHTLFVREHNRLADEIAAADPNLTGEEIYQQARRIVAAEMQAIAYNEFIPALLGSDALGNYTGYDESVNASISNIFSTAAYRFGHSLLPSELLRLDDAGTEIAADSLALRDAFFRPSEITSEGIDPLLKGLSLQPAQEIDTHVVDDVRNFLFGPPGSGGFDLASLNIQRGRDHGLPDYNLARVDFGLSPATSFSDITSDVELQLALEATYGSVDNIDVWVGGLAEDHLPGSSVGELNQTILVDQFRRLRDGDRFWYEADFSGADLIELQNTTLADVILRNTNLTSLQDNVFLAVPMQIDIQPANDSNSIQMNSNGMISVALFTTDTFDASSVDISTIFFAGASVANSVLRDVGGDGDLDLVLHFHIEETNLLEVYEQHLEADFDEDGILDSTHQQIQVSLTGNTSDGQFFAGFDQLDLFLSGNALQEILDELFGLGA